MESLLLSSQLRPDFEQFRQVLLRQGKPERVHYVELNHDQEIVDAVMSVLPGDDGSDEREMLWRRRLRFWHRLGYDYVTVGVPLDIPLPWKGTDDTAARSRGQRHWIEESLGPIQTREDFERYPWPGSGRHADLSGFEITAKYLPEGMKIIGATWGGVFETVVFTMGYSNFAFALADDPAFVGEIFDKVGGMLVEVYRQIADMDEVGALWLGDDLGYKHSTMISPDALRTFVFPWHKKIVDVAHAAGKPLLLHSCGDVRQIMDDLIDCVGIDAKHSFEDAVIPVGEAKRLWGHRIAILGGVDMGFLATASPEAVRDYVRRVLEECMPGGGYALGSGNTIANYIPVENFLAMLDEGRKFCQHGA